MPKLSKVKGMIRDISPDNPTGVGDAAVKNDRRPVLSYRRPLIPVVAAYGTGVIAGPLFPFKPLLFACVLLLLLVSVGMTLWTGRHALTTTLLLFGFLLFGALRYLQVLHPHGAFHLSKISDALLAQTVEVEGVIVSPPERYPPGEGWRRDERIRFLAELQAVTLAGVRYPATGMARLSIVGPVQEYRYGHQIRGRFRLRRPRGYWNPGAFNYRRYAMTRGFYLEGWGRDRGGIQILDRKGGSQILQGLSDLRQTMLERMDLAFHGEEKGVLQAMVLGDRSGLSPAVQEAFLGSGTYHILVISGLHVGFLAGLIFFAARFVRLPLSLSSLLTVLGVVFYAFLTGGSPPVVRATLMASLYLLALIVGRERDMVNALALAAFLLVLWNPLYLFDAGFQLTFTATGAIVLAFRQFDLSRFSGASRWVLASLLASTAATLATGLLLAFHFNRISLMGIAANLFVVPLGGCVTAAGMAYSFLLLLVPQGIPLMGLGVSSLASAMITVASKFSTLPLASIRLYTPTPLMVLTGYGVLALILVPRVRRRLLFLAVATTLLLGQIAWKLFPADRGGIEATFLDVGQGDAIFLELPGRRTMLVDGGGSFDDRFDIGEQVVAPYLWHRWVRRLDVIVLSHPQPDHIGGLRAVIENFPVGEVWESGYPSKTPTYLWLQAFVREKGIPLRRIKRGERISVGAEVMVTVLHPPKPFITRPKARPSALVNNNSLVLAIAHQQTRLLLTGDIEKDGEASLLDAGEMLQADLVKIPHHGSRGSSSTAFLRRVKPRWAVVQAGDRNPFGHPHPETLSRYATEGVEVLRTDRHGAISFAFRDGAVTGRTHRDELGVWADDGTGFYERVKGLTREGGYVK